MTQKVVLFVEDDQDDLELSLVAMEGLLKPYEVVTVRDGAQALEYLLGTGIHAGRDVSRKPVLIVLDMHLPRVNGMQVLERLNQEWGSGLGGVKVAVLSSSHLPDERVRMRNLGAALHLRKPLRQEESAAMIREIAGLLSPDSA